MVLLALHSLCFRCSIIEVLKKEALNNERKEVWEAQWSKGMAVWIDWGSYTVKHSSQRGDFENYFCSNSVYLYMQWDITSFSLSVLKHQSLSTFLKPCQCSNKTERVLLYNLWARLCRAQNKCPSRMKCFYWLCGVNWPLNNQINKLSQCSRVVHCQTLTELLLTN